MQVDNQLKVWLNDTNRKLLDGIAIYRRLGKDLETLKKVEGLVNNKADNAELFAILRQLWYDSKNGVVPAPSIKKIPSKPIEKSVTSAVAVVKNNSQKSELFISCEKAASKLYQELRNLKAKLFYTVSIEPDRKENNPELVALRQPMVLELMNLQIAVDEAYDTLRYVAEHGHLPTKESDKETKLPSNPVLLERYRITQMKLLSKLKLKEATPQRVQLINTKLELIKKAENELNRFIAEWRG